MQPLPQGPAAVWVLLVSGLSHTGPQHPESGLALVRGLGGHRALGAGAGGSQRPQGCDGAAVVVPLRQGRGYGAQAAQGGTGTQLPVSQALDVALEVGRGLVGSDAADSGEQYRAQGPSMTWGLPPEMQLVLTGAKTSPGKRVAGGGLRR